MDAAEFSRQWDKVTKQNLVLQERLSKQAGPSLYKKKNVVGFGVSTVRGRSVVVVYLKKRTPPSRTARKDRIPRSIMLGRLRLAVKTKVIGTPQLAVAIGDPTENQKSYHLDGVGDWQMGTKITIWPQCTPGRSAAKTAAVAAAASLPVTGTSGARVLRKTEKFMLTCSHVLKANHNDVAQCAENRVDPCNGASALKNHVGEVVEIADLTKADAGITECNGAQRKILHIGAYRQPADPREGLYVMKDGATTGLTFSKITEATAQLKIDNVEYKGLFSIENYCPDAPPLAQAKYGDPSTNPNAIKAVLAKDRFGYSGDSGALIVVGKPDGSRFAVEGSDLEKEYDSQSDTEKAKTLGKYHRAALGLLVSVSLDVRGGQKVTVPNAFGQRIQRALDALGVTLDCEP